MRSALTGTVAMVLAFAVPIALLALHAWSYYFLCDDAFISFRYARNLVDGHGLVFNRGERVEGYTNFLWVLEIAAALKLGLKPEVACSVLSVLYTAGTVALTAALAASAPRARRAAVWIALALLASNRSFAVWSTGGLETRQFTFLVLLAIVLLRSYPERGPRGLAGASLALAAAELTRPEGLLVWGCVGVWHVVDSAARRGVRARELAALHGPVAALVGAQFVFRRLYYGDWLPNTYYAKHVRPWVEAGWEYVVAAGLEHALYLLLPLAAAGLFARLRVRDSVHALSAFVCGAHVAYLVRIGGDHFEFRPMDLYWPLLACAGADGVLALVHVAGRARRALGSAVGGAVVALLLVYGSAVSWASRAATGGLSTLEETELLHVPLSPETAPAAFRLPFFGAIASRYDRALDFLVPHFIANRWLQHAVYCRTRLEQYGPYETIAGRGVIPPDAVTAMSGVGVAPYHLIDLTVIDILGLTDRVVARNPVEISNQRRWLAHDRRPPRGYLRERGLNIELFPAARSLADALESALDAAPAAIRLGPELWMPFYSEKPDWVARAFAGREIVALGGVFANGEFRLDLGVIGAFDGEVDRIPDGWTFTGSARVRARGASTSSIGAGLLTTEARAGGASLGSASSPRFMAGPRRALVFRLGGTASQRAMARLMGADGPLATWHGEGDDVLRPVFVPLDPWVGRTLWLELVDEEPGGHLLLDHVRLAE